ncbi:D-alanyl-D-alanine carboxypeptidase/D-alanyl-D-alanine-endopeptidase [Pinibacter soli]|uniref:D-alanyl-D-alanine carboxypeptidase n=1 Tax=Pinibacter soli TaxID=3044211 RepID=A0ABT6REI2_9BACT|nr:D-alanyl-D-alanine carboxypeptidase [Pinibacter soli]MDI3320279.1 D-alanyl-D-alanine carboxypeptidase [Pinibacter soli]
MKIIKICVLSLCLGSCSLQKKIAKVATRDLIKDSSLAAAHVGICIYEPSANKYWYNYQADKYFVPASNTKLFTLYAGMKFLSDSIDGIRYQETKDAIYLQPTGDPTFLHPDFLNQPIVKWLQQTSKKVYITDSNWQEKPLGYGWAWDDYSSYYMTERSPFPVYGNVIKWTQMRQQDASSAEDNIVYSEPEVDWKVKFNPERTSAFNVIRRRDENVFEISQGKEIMKVVDVPFFTNGVASALELLKDTLQKEITVAEKLPSGNWQVKKSQPTDSMFREMIHSSDNFMAEQTLLMVANKQLGVMNDGRIIDTLLKSAYKDLPQNPTWVDGSGLSRYNLFTPQDFVWLLSKMKNEFPWQRISTIFPTGNTGTLKGYYKTLTNNLYAKTGTLTGQIALSGYFTTRHNKQLVFSILVNNHHAANVDVRKAIEKFLLEVYEKY